MYIHIYETLLIVVSCCFILFFLVRINICIFSMSLRINHVMIYSLFLEDVYVFEHFCVI